MTRGRGFSRQVRAVFMTALILGSAVGAAWVPVGAARAESNTDNQSVASKVASTEPDRFEPNDDWDNATHLDPGTYENLQISSEDVDLFVLEDIPEGDVVSIRGSFHYAGPNSIRMFYPDPEDGTLRNVTRSRESRGVTLRKQLDRVDYRRDDLIDGAVYVAVWSDTTTGYDLTLSIQEDGSRLPVDRFEPNEEWDNAPRLDPGTYAGLTVSNQDYDLYVLDDLEAGDDVSVEMSANRYGDHAIRLYYPDTETGTLRSVTRSARSMGVSLNRTLDRVDYERENLTDGAVYIGVRSETATEYELSLSVASGEPGPEPDRFEPNEKPTDPATLEPGNYTGLTFHNESDSDWYEVPVDRGDNITVTTRGQAGLVTQLFVPETVGNANTLQTTTGTVWATVGETEFQNESYRDGTVFFYVVGDPGEYSLQVSIDEPPEPDPYEPNDEYTNAAVLQPGNHTDLNQHTYNDYDWYKIPVDTGDNITIRGGSATGPLSMLGYFPQENGVDSFLATGGEVASATITGTSIENETFDDGYVYVTPATDIGEYWLDVSIDEPPEPDRFEPNDEPATATTLQPGNHTDLTRHGPDDYDWYRVPVDVGDNVTIRTGSADGSAGMVGYFPQTGEPEFFFTTREEEIASATITGTNYANETYDDGYVYVGPTPDIGEYWLNVTVRDRGPEPDRFEPNDEMSNAVKLEPGNTTGLTLRGESAVDWYKVPVDPGDNVTVRTGGTEAPATVLYYRRYDQRVPATSLTGGPVSGTVGGTDWPNETIDDGYAYVSISGMSGEYWLDVRVTDSGPEPDRFEPNDEWDQAPRLDPGTYSDLTISGDDIDLFVLDDLEKGETVSVSASFDRSGDHLLRMFYPETERGTLQNVTESSESGSLSLNKTLARVAYEREDLIDGAVYIGLRSDTATEYDLNLSVERTAPDVPPDRFEPNDEFGNAPVMRPGNYSVTHSGHNDTDWYRVPVDAGDNVTVESDVPVTLYYPGPDGSTQVVTFPNGGPGSQRVSMTNWADSAPDDGYVYLTTTGDNRRYRLNVSVTDGIPDPDRFEPNDRIQTAATLPPGTHSLTFSGQSDSDWYKVPVEPGSTLSVSAETPVTIFHPLSNGEVGIETVVDGSPVSQRIQTTDWLNETMVDGFVYLHTVGERSRYSLNVTLEEGPNRPPTVDRGRTTTDTGFAYERYVVVTNGSTVTFRLNASDPDGSLRKVVWAQDDEILRQTPLDGATGTATFTRTFDQAGGYVLWGSAVDDHNATSDVVKWRVVVGKRPLDEFSVQVERINGRDPDADEYHLDKEFVHNVTVSLTRPDGRPLTNESLAVSMEGTGDVTPLTHIGDGRYRAHFDVDTDSLVYTQRLRFDVSYYTPGDSAFRNEPEPNTYGTTSTYATVITRRGLFREPVPGWVFNGTWNTVYPDGEPYIAVEMRRDGDYEPAVEGVPRTAWLVFDREGRLVENSTLRHRAALTAEVDHNLQDLDIEKIRFFQEELPSRANEFRRTAERLELLYTVRDTIAEMAGSITAAAFTGGSSVIAKQSVKATSKRLAKDFARRLVNNHLTSEIAPDNVLGATKQGLETMANAELQEGARESREVGRILDRHYGNDVTYWSYDDAKAYRQSWEEAVIDVEFYMEVRDQLLPNASAQNQLQSIVYSYVEGGTGIPAGDIDSAVSDLSTYLRTGGFGYLSAAQEETARIRALHRIENRSFTRYSRAAQQTALERYGDRPLIGWGVDDNTDSGDSTTAEPAPADSTSAVRLAAPDERVTVTVTQVDAVANVTVDGVRPTGRVRVTNRTVLSANVTSPRNRSVAVFDVAAPIANESATVTVSVTQAAIANADATVETLGLAHYHNGSWQTLNTSVVSTAGPVVLSAPISGFSPLAVIVRGTEQQTEDTATETATPTATVTPNVTETATSTPPRSSTPIHEPTRTPTQTSVPDESPTESESGPGFGVAVAVVALLAAALLARRRD